MGMAYTDLPPHLKAKIDQAEQRPPIQRVPLAKSAQTPESGMNKWEEAYANKLATDQKVGKILYYRFEAIKLRLAKNTFYTPDFLVLNQDHHLEIHEVKGYWRDDARVKVKVVAEMYPMFRYIIVTQEKGAWTYTPLTR